MVASPGDIEAIPAFARAYDLPCSTCHTAITRRSEFGDVFRKAGYRWPGPLDIDARARKPPPLEMRGISAMTGLFPAELPLSLSATMAATYNSDTDLEDPVTLGSPSLRLLLGGALGRHVGFFGTWGGQGTPDELYVHITRPLMDRPELNFLVGRFEQTTTLFKSNESLLAPYMLGSSALNGHAVSQGRVGIEANGVLFKRIFWAAGAVQNGGVGSNIDTYYHVSQKIGGMDFLGEEPDINLDDPSLWEDIVLTVGHWAYGGRVADPSGNNVSRVRRLGFDGKLRFRALNLWAGVMVGFDRDLTTYIDSRNVTWFGEVSYSVTSWLMPIYLYQYQDSSALREEFDRHDIGVVFLPVENMRARVKLGITDDNTKNEVAELQLLFGF